MGEGVDPTEMCQNLVSKVKRSQELVAEAHPELILLFEEWLETLEEELLSLLREKPSLGAEEVTLRLGLSRAGAGFLLEKLRTAKTP